MTSSLITSSIYRNETFEAVGQLNKNNRSNENTSISIFNLNKDKDKVFEQNNNWRIQEWYRIAHKINTNLNSSKQFCSNSSNHYFNVGFQVFNKDTTISSSALVQKSNESTNLININQTSLVETEVKWGLLEDHTLIYLKMNYPYNNWNIITKTFNETLRESYTTHYIKSRWDTHLKLANFYVKGSYCMQDNLNILEAYRRNHFYQWVKISKNLNKKIEELYFYCLNTLMHAYYSPIISDPCLNLNWHEAYDKRLVLLIHEKINSWDLIAYYFNQHFHSKFPVDYLRSRWETYLKDSYLDNQI